MDIVCGGIFCRERNAKPERQVYKEDCLLNGINFFFPMTRGFQLKNAQKLNKSFNFFQKMLTHRTAIGVLALRIILLVRCGVARFI